MFLAARTISLPWRRLSAYWRRNLCRPIFVRSQFIPKVKLKRSAFLGLQPFELTATMLNRTHDPHLASLVAFTRTAAAFRTRQRSVVQSRPRDKRSEHTLRVMERTTPLAAVGAALTPLACCLPLSFLGAGLAGAVAWTGTYRAGFLGLAVVLLILGFVRIYRKRNQCGKRSKASSALFWTAVVLVALIVLFPQVIASFLAG